MENIFDTSVLVQVVPNLKTSQNWLLDRFFPNVVTYETEEVAIDVDVGLRRMAPFVSPLVEGKLVESRKYQTNTFKPAYIKDKRAPDLRKPIRRQISERIGGEYTAAEREMLNLQFEMTDQIDMINRRLEWMAASALVSGTVTVAGEGYETQVVDFGRASDLTITLSGSDKWPLTVAAGATNTRYGRYSKGSVGGSSSAVAGKSSVADVDDEKALADKVTAQSVMDRKNVTDRSSQLSSSNTPDEFVQGVADVVNAILNSAGSVNDRITALEKLANSISTEYQQSDSSKAISATMNTLIVVLCTGAMTSAAADSRPASTDEAEELTQRVSVQLDMALVLAGDRADDDMYNALLAVRSAFLSTMSERASGLSELLQVTTAQPLPALTLANRLYQDATRADELVQEARVPHPAFMPTTMKVLRQ
ncbi:hypothetical protein EY777_19305 [Escherichia coli]|nr:hypothetical protein [Escherichia coli]